MADMRELVQLVAPLVPGVPNPVILQQARETLFEFCKATQVWRTRLMPFATSPEIDTLSLAPCLPADAVVYDILSLAIEGRTLEAGSYHRAVQLNALGSGRPRLYDASQEANQILLYPTPDREYEVTGEVTLVPRWDTDYIDDRLLGEYTTGLKHGVVSSLAGMVDKPWTNPDMAQASAMHFARELENAARRAQQADGKKARFTGYGGL